MNGIDISIILPIYNGEQTIKETVKSLLNQSFNNFELLACIDGTNDRSEEILYSFNDPRIRVIKNVHNLGLAGTLNRLMHHVSSESKYIAMAEQDDWYYPERLKKQFIFLENNHEYGLVSGIAEHFSGDIDNIKLFPGILANGGQYPKEYNDFFKLNYREQIKVVNTCMMFRKSVYLDNGLYFSRHFPNISVDWSFVLRFSQFAPIFGINEIMVRMNRFIDRNSITMNKSKQYKAAKELIRMFYYENAELLTKEDYRYAMNTECLLEVSQYKFCRRFMLLLWMAIRTPKDHRVKKKLYRENRKILKKLSRKKAHLGAKQRDCTSSTISC